MNADSVAWPPTFIPPPVTPSLPLAEQRFACVLYYPGSARHGAIISPVPTRFSVLSLSWTQRYTLFLLITLLSLVGVTLFLGVSGYRGIYHIPFQVYRNGGYMALFVFFFSH